MNNQKNIVFHKITTGVDKYSVNDFIYNRPDKQAFNQNNYIALYNNVDHSINVMFSIENGIATLGLWMVDIEKHIVKQISKAIFKSFKKVRTIEIKYSKNKIGYAKKINHYDLDIPSDLEGFKKTVKKNHSREKRKRAILSDLLGEEKFVCVSSQNCSEEVIKKYFNYKAKTMGIDYNLSAKDYLKKYYVTDVYYLQYGNEIVSVLLSCQQCKIVYLENITYNPDYSKYSPGKLIYINYICSLIENKFAKLYLGGGDYQYKKYFGSHEVKTYLCVIKKYWIFYPMFAIKQLIKKILKISY